MAMTSLHAAVGIAIVKAVPNPLISIPLALLSHIILDIYPEYYTGKGPIFKNIKKYNWKEWTLATVQLFLLLSICGFLLKSGSLIMLLGAITANLFDLWDFIYEKITGRCMWFFHPRGWFPFKLKRSWQGLGIIKKFNPILNSILDIIIVALILVSL